MSSLPIIAGLISVVSALIILISLIAYKRTGMIRMLSIAGIGGILLIKGALFIMDIMGLFRLTYETEAVLDLIMAVFLAIMLFGKE